MTGELDDIEAQVDCPKCGAVLSVAYRTLRLQKAVGCACGALVGLEDATPLAAVKGLIDEANPMSAEND